MAGRGRMWVVGCQTIFFEFSLFTPPGILIDSAQEKLWLLELFCSPWHFSLKLKAFEEGKWIQKSR